MTGVKGIRGAAKGNAKGRATQAKRGVQRNKKNVNTFKRQGRVQAGFIKKKNVNGVTKQKANLNRGLQRSNAKSNTVSGRRLNSMSRNKFSRSNLTFGQNKLTAKRTTSMPNLRDPDSVHNRLGYQTPAQIAYRNKIKRAKQMLIQNQKLSIQNNMRSRVIKKKTMSNKKSKFIMWVVQKLHFFKYKIEVQVMFDLEVKLCLDSLKNSHWSSEL